MDEADIRPRIGPVHVGIVLLALATVGIHLYYFLIEGFLALGAMGPPFQVLFVGIFLAYVLLVSTLYFFDPSLARFRPFTRALLIGLAVASIASYFYVGVFDLGGNSDKAIETLLIVLLLTEASISRFGVQCAERKGRPGLRSMPGATTETSIKFHRSRKATVITTKGV